jgi:hypothetical protein
MFLPDIEGANMHGEVGHRHRVQHYKPTLKIDPSKILMIVPRIFGQDKKSLHMRVDEEWIKKRTFGLGNTEQQVQMISE